jgi:hypothetical protein
LIHNSIVVQEKRRLQQGLESPTTQTSPLPASRLVAGKDNINTMPQQ